MCVSYLIDSLIFLIKFSFFEKSFHKKFNAATVCLIARKILEFSVESCYKNPKLSKIRNFLFFNVVKKIEKIHMDSVKITNLLEANK